MQKLKSLPVALLLTGTLSCGIISHAATVTGTRIVTASANLTQGTLHATIDGKDRVLSKTAWRSWITENKHAVLWADADGAGGYENEGQSLWRYNANTGRRYKVMSEEFEIQNVIPVRTRSGKSVLVVSMQDGGLGAPHVAVVDPLRGEVWRHMKARVAGIRNGNLAIAVLREDDISGDPAKDSYIRPLRMIYLNLDEVLKRPVLHIRNRWR